MKIYFYSPSGYTPLKHPSLRPMLLASHGWSGEGETAVYGVCIPSPTTDPNDIADRLESLGVHVLPGIHSTDKPHPAIHAALAHHGVKPEHGTREIAKIMHEKSGMPVLRPHYF